MEQPTKLTQTRSSLQFQSSFLRKFYRMMCPCLSNYKEDIDSQDRNHTDYFASNSSNRSNTQRNVKEFQLPRKNTLDFYQYSLSYKLPDSFAGQSGANGNKKDNKSRSFVVKIDNTHKKKRQSARQTIDLRQLSYMSYIQKNQWHNFPVYKFQQGQLIILGKNNKNLLAQISTVKLEPSPSAVQQQFLSKQNNSQSDQCRGLDDFWNKRYFYFDKFDQGIQIDKESLSNLTPEAVSDYITAKCSECKVALDAFSGIGHNATSLGTSCEKVICVEDQAKKYNCLINNAKCYEIYNIQLFLKPFLEIDLKTKVDVVLLHPYILNQNYLLSSMCQPKHFIPDLGAVIKKSLQISSNIVLILPPNISIKEICYQISKSSEQITDKNSCSCTVKIQKIFFRNNLSFVAVFFGPNVQQEIKINSELGYIYKMLKNPDQKGFFHKKLIKSLRQKYGMIRLLNFVSESISHEKEGMTQLQKFVDYVKNKQLIPQHKFLSLLTQDKNNLRKGLTRQISNEFQDFQVGNQSQKKIEEPYTFSDPKQKFEEIQERDSYTERTHSFYSSVSGFSDFKKRSTINNMTQSGKRAHKDAGSDIQQKGSYTSSIIVKKINNDDNSFIDKQSKSPASPNDMDIKNNFIGRNTHRRHTTKIEKIQQQFNLTGKQKLKQTLIQN